MCQIPDHTPHLGSRLEDGHAHAEDHRLWSRRAFMQTLGLGGVAATFMLGATPVKAYGRHQLVTGDLESSDRVLVLIQLKGGNDGLNTVVPIRNDVYYRKRPTLAIARSSTLPLTSEFGLHPAMHAMHRMWDEGKMGIVQGVGYPNQSLSHFRSTDIWNSGSNADTHWNTGWAGRTFSEAGDGRLPEYPLAVQLGLTSSLMFKGPEGSLGMNIANNATLERLARGGDIYDEAEVPATPYGSELAFARSVANNAYQYGGVVHEALNAGSNHTSYPNTRLANGLANISKMINGGLKTKLYLVTLNGFDTHAQQLTRHETLLTQLSEAMAAFQFDLELSGDATRVMTMTFSEFGRRVEENGSEGTDHGAAAPLFVMGHGVNGGMYGDTPQLAQLDRRGNQDFTTDFRRVYSSVLNGWLGFEPALINEAMGGTFDTIPFVYEGSLDQGEGPDAAFTLEPAFPNPFNFSTRIRFELADAAYVRLKIYDAAGREVATLTDENRAPGRHQVTFYADQLASGIYFYELQIGEERKVRQVTLVR